MAGTLATNFKGAVKILRKRILKNKKLELRPEGGRSLIICSLVASHLPLGIPDITNSTQ